MTAAQNEPCCDSTADNQNNNMVKSCVTQPTKDMPSALSQYVVCIWGIEISRMFHILLSSEGTYKRAHMEDISFQAKNPRRKRIQY